MDAVATVYPRTRNCYSCTASSYTTGMLVVILLPVLNTLFTLNTILPFYKKNKNNNNSNNNNNNKSANKYDTNRVANINRIAILKFVCLQ